MTAKKLFIEIGLIGDDIIAEANSLILKRKLKISRNLIAMTSAAAAFVIIAVALLTQVRNNNDIPSIPGPASAISPPVTDVAEIEAEIIAPIVEPIEIPPSTEPTVTVSEPGGTTANPTTSTAQEQIAWIPPWNEMTVTQQFQIISFNGSDYHAGRADVALSYVGDYIGDGTASGWDVYENNKEYTIKCEVFELKNISSQAAVAVKFEGYNHYHTYGNYSYQPETLGDLIQDLNLYDNMVFGDISESGFDEQMNYQRHVYTLPDTAVIWELLLDDGSLKNQLSPGENPHMSLDRMVVGVSVDVLASGNFTLSVTKDDYLWTNILGTQKLFYIGKSKADAFVDYVHNNAVINNIN
ncbi:MAG: hypothetical protein FWG90_14125 [Oscillospiraceae bacterium]|nr:hypothetical protein [Oscillospiraceae bacterium]